MTNAEIRVGEYVRTKRQGIKKIVRINENKTVNKYLYFIGYDHSDKEYGIIKANENIHHSFNIIDLIEVGDYVNGIEVEVIGYDNNENGELVETLGVAYVDDDVAWRTELKDISHIYTIVTKEQFKAMEYKVGGEDD